MSNVPYNTSHLKYHYHVSISADERPLRPELDKDVFHRGEIGATLSVINEVANQLGIESLTWCHFMEDVLRNELAELRSREDILCGLHERIAAQLFHQHAGPSLHR